MKDLHRDVDVRDDALERHLTRPLAVAANWNGGLWRYVEPLN